MDEDEKPPVRWEFEFRVVTPDNRVLTHKSFSAFDEMETRWFSGHVNRIVDQVYLELMDKGYVS